MPHHGCLDDPDDAFNRNCDVKRHALAIRDAEDEYSFSAKLEEVVHSVKSLKQMSCGRGHRAGEIKTDGEFFFAGDFGGQEKGVGDAFVQLDFHLDRVAGAQR